MSIKGIISMGKHLIIYKNWLIVISYTLFIYITLPYAPILRDSIINSLGERIISIIVGAIVGSIGIIIFLFLKRQKSNLSSYIWLIILSAIYTYFLLTINIIVEKVHFIQYGLLSLFIFYALRNHFNDLSIYLIGTLLVVILGLVDEYIQGILPNRVGEIRDIWWNGLAGLLVQVAILKVIKPGSINKRIDFKSLKVVGIELMIIAISMGIFITKIHEFGFVIKDPYIGKFYSRLPKSEILNIDRERFIENGEIIDRVFNDKDYAKSLNILQLPFLYEMAIHIFRRGRYAEKGDLFVACKENLILYRYFKETIKHTRYWWDRDKMDLCDSLPEQKMKDFYESPVSSQLFTLCKPITLWV